MVNQTVTHIEQHEGSLYYSDQNGREAVEVLGALSIALHRQAGGYQTVWAQVGYAPAVIEALATFYLKSPWMKVAVDGFYNGLVLQQQITEAQAKSPQHPG